MDRLWVIGGAPDCLGFPGSSDGKESACNAGNLGLIPGLGRSPGEGNGNPFQYSCLGNSMDRGAWRATVQGSQRVRHDGGTNTSTTWLLAPGSGMIMPRNIVLPPTLRATWRRRDFEWLSLQIKNSL